MIPQILTQIVLIGFNAVFASAEIALISLNPAKLEKEADGGSRQAKRLLKLIRRPSGYLAMIQVGVTIAGFLGSAFAADSFAFRLTGLLQSLGVPLTESTLKTAAVIITTLAFSYISMVLGELFPKQLAMRKSEKLAYALSGFLLAATIIFSPIVRLLSGAVNLLLRLCGIDPNAPGDPVTEEEIRLMVDEGSQRGAIDQHEKQMIQNVFEFDDTTCGDLMTHRLDASLLWLKDDDAVWQRTIVEGTHDFYPVCGETIDEVAGVLSSREFLLLDDRSRQNTMRKAVREPQFVPESLKADMLFRTMRRSRNHFALVLDEYGGLSGIITMNNLLEAIVGGPGSQDTPESRTSARSLANRYRSMSIYADFIAANGRPTGLCYDSREAVPGSLYFALPGLHLDGHDFIDDAIKRGATHIVHEDDLESYVPGVSYLKVASSRFAMSPIADEFYGSPSKKLTVIGVTGTEGKSTTVFLIFQLLRLCGKKAGFISTVQFSEDGTEQWNTEHQTTPEAPVIHRRLARMVENGCEFAVLESSSHGLSPRTNRLGDVAFDAAVMTNVMHEHLEFHGTWEQYRDDKANLFRVLGAVKKAFVKECFGVVSADDSSAAYFAAAASRHPVLSFSVRGAAAGQTAPASQAAQAGQAAPAGQAAEADAAPPPLPVVNLSVESLHAEAGGNRYTVTARPAGGVGSAGFAGGDSCESFQITDALPGAFNAGNVLAAMLVVSRFLGAAYAGLCPLIAKLQPVRGRMTAVDTGQDFEVLVDYAHTPSSFRTIYPPLRKRADSSGARIISVFGSPGERDTQKRALQGEVAARYSDIVILTDEDPRGEEPMSILEEIAAGIKNKEQDKNLFLIPDRPAALRKAFSLARIGDIVLLLGKGHENSIIYSGGPIPYDEIAEAEKALSEL